MRIVITGATGNIGTALLRRLAGSGEHDLVGIARRPPDGAPPYDAAQWSSIDLTSDDDEPALRAAFTGADAVVHLAWGFQPSHREDRLEALGVGGTRRVIAAVEAAGVPHLVHMSSVGAYAPKQGDEPVDESWPTTGLPTSVYSRHKAAAERLLDELEADPSSPTVVSRVRPGIVGQRDAGSALLRYALPAVVPGRVVGHLPVLPVDRRLVIPIVHADDVADAVVRVLERAAPGGFNLAATQSVTADDIAAALDARVVHVPAPALRAAVSLSWHARLQQLDPGWIDLAYAVPLVNTARATTELGWTAAHEATSVLAETVRGMREGAWQHSPVLRPRTVPAALARFLARGPVSGRRHP